jgi:DNA polymerase III alpha subunit
VREGFESGSCKNDAAKPPDADKAYRERLDYEIGVINDMGSPAIF